MKRKELIGRFKVSNSFLNLLITRADILKGLKVGTGYASEYDDKSVFLILIGWELHKFGIAFRHINQILLDISNQTMETLKSFFLRKNNLLVIDPVVSSDVPVRQFIVEGVRADGKKIRKKFGKPKDLVSCNFAWYPVSADEMKILFEELHKQEDEENIEHRTQAVMIINAHKIMKEVYSE